jgi:hypothetical protein
MKKYIGTKQVSAEPMNLGEFIKTTGRNPYANSEDVHGDNEEGYLVEYEDGYKSWSPKDVFEKAYRVAETAEDRMAIEIDELIMRSNKLLGFILSPKHESLDELTKAYLDVQWGCMDSYINLLKSRLVRMQGKKQFGKGFMKFGIAMEMAANGIPVRREGWDENFVLIKQVFSYIDVERIASMTSLPKAVKELLISKGNDLSYDNQLIVCDTESGRINSYVPTMDDIFTKDWIVAPYEGYFDKELLDIFRKANNVGTVKTEEDGTQTRRDVLNVTEVRSEILKRGIKPDLDKMKAMIKTYYPAFAEDEKVLNTFVRFFFNENDDVAGDMLKRVFGEKSKERLNAAKEFVKRHMTDGKIGVNAARQEILNDKLDFTSDELKSAVCNIFEEADWQEGWNAVDCILESKPKQDEK